MTGLITAVTSMVVFPLLLGGYLAHALNHGGAKRLWRDGLLIVAVLVGFSYWQRQLVFWYGGPLAAEGIQTSGLVLGALAALLVVQGLAHRRVPRPVRVAAAAITVSGFALLLRWMS